MENTYEVSNQLTPNKTRHEHHRERNIGFSHHIALTLNKLIDEKILTAGSVSNASNETIDEFIGRFQGHESFSPDEEEKIKTLFGARRTDINNIDLKFNREKIIEMGRFFLRAIDNTQPKNIPQVVGILCFGSRMDHEKTPDEKSSDFDTIFITTNPAISQPYLTKKQTWEILDCIMESSKDFKKEYNISADLQEWGIISTSEFLEETNPAVVDPFPVWGWKPKSVYFVGTLFGYNEDQMNVKIQKYLSSDIAKKQKEKVINFIKENIKYRKI